MPKSVIKLFFLLVFASGTYAWVRLAHGNALRVRSEASFLSTGNGDPVLFTLNAFVILTTLIVAFPKLKTLFAALVHERAMLMIYLYSVLSVLWAENTGNSVRVAVYLFFGLLQFTYIGWSLDAEEQAATLGKIVTFFAIVSILGEYLLPPNPDLAPGWTGVFLNKNLLGNVMALGIVATLLQRGRWSLSRIARLCLCATMLILSQSFTAMLCVLACGMVILYLRLTRRQRLLLVGTSTSLLVFVTALLPNFLTLLLGASGRDTTLTGRDVIWRFALKYIALRPFFGYGYYGFWISQQDAALQFLGWNPNQAHNGFLDLALNEGLAGLGILFAVLYLALRRSLRQIRNGDATGAGRWSLVLLVYVLVHNVAEADFYQRLAWAIFLMAYIASVKADLPVQCESQYEPYENFAQ